MVTMKRNFDAALELLVEAPLPYDNDGNFVFDDYEIDNIPNCHHSINENGELELWFGEGAIVLHKDGTWYLK